MKQKINSRFLVKNLSPLLVLGALTQLTYAQTTRTWDGGGTPNDNLDIAANWSGDAVPNGATNDIAQWDGTVPGALNLTYTGTGTGAPLVASPALSFNILGTQTSPITINEASGTQGIRIRDITVASGAGAFTIGGTGVTDYLNLGSTNVTSHAFTNNSANPVTFESDVVFGAGNAVTHNVTLGGTGNWNINASLERASMGTINVIKSGSGTLNLGHVIETNRSKGLGTATFTINSGTLENASGRALSTATPTIVLNGDFAFSNPSSTNLNDLTFGPTIATTPVASVANLGTAAGTSRTITTNGAAMLTIPGVISNGTTANSIIKNGSGTLKLDGGNSFSGGVTLNAGILHLGGNGALGGGTFTINGGLVVPRTAWRTLANPVSINSDFAIGANTINNQIAFSGAVDLNGGVRAIDVFDTTVAPDAVFSGVISNGGITKNGAGSLSLTGENTFSGNLTVNAGRLVLNSTGTPAVTLNEGFLDAKGTLGAVTIGNSGMTTFATGNGSTAKLTTGNFTITGPAILNVTISSAGAGLQTGVLTTSGNDGEILLNITKPDPWVNGLNNIISFSSFPSADINDFYYDIVNSAPLGARQNPLGLVQNGNNIALLVEGTSVYWTGLQSNQWTFNSIPGLQNWKTTLGNEATDFIDDDDVVFNDTPGTDQTIQIDDASLRVTTATFNNSARNYTFGSANGFGISSGSVFKNGTGTVTFNLGNTYSGLTTLNAGRINANTATALGSGGMVINGGTLGNTSGGAITFANNNVQTWNGDFTFAGPNDLSLGTGAVTTGGTGDRTVTVSGSNTLTVGELKTAVEQGFVKQGTGTLALTSLGDGGNASVVNGNLNVAAGTLQINRTGGADAAATGDLTVASLSGSGTITNGSNHERWLRVNGSGDTTFPGTLSDGGPGKLGLEKLSTTLLTLSGTNSYSGVTTVRSGTLSITGTNLTGSRVNLTGSTANPAILLLQNSNALGTALVNAANRTSSIQLQGGITLPPSVTFLTSGDASVAGTPSVITSLSGDNVIQGAVALTTGGGNTSFQVDSGTLKVTGDITIAAGQASRGITLQGASTGDNVFSGVLSDLSVTSFAQIIKAGTGTWTVSGANTYTGVTNVNAGKLVISGNNSAATGLVTVAADATLAGSGNLGGAVTIAAGGIHSLAVAATPGAQVTRTIGGALTNVTGSVLNLTIGATPADGVYTLVTANGGISGLPTTVTGFTGGTVSISGNSLILTVGGAPSGYAAWASSKGLTALNNGATQDPDFDGLSNVLEFALDGNPLSSDTNKVPVSTQDATNFYFDFNRRDDSLAEVTLTFEYGTTLAAWPSSVAIPSSNTPLAGPPVAITDNGNGTHHIKVTVPKAGNTTLFGRLKAVK